MRSSLVSQSASTVRKCIIKSTSPSALLSSTKASQVRQYYTMASKYAVKVASTTKWVAKKNLPSSSLFRREPVSISYPELFPAPMYPREIVFLGGAPGSGKGTNQRTVAQVRGFDAPSIVVSDLLNTPECKLLKDNGIMVDDDFVFKALLTELRKPIYRNGVVVDGFPRTAAQVDYLTNFHTELSDVSSFLNPAPRLLFVMLHVNETESISRQIERGKQTMLQNELNEAMGKPTVEVRQTDIDITASKARYEVFKEQLDAVMTLKQQFPLVVVDASGELKRVKENISLQMSSLPSALL